ncbi:MAG: methylmalonyl-CoA epimerase [Chlorobiaceae bacterium]|nr:methylmalonyl-CoA epimerase [Chlorobiaceae bacterium]
MINRIDHIAIAVQDLDVALGTFLNVLGCDPASVVIEEVPAEKVRVAFITIGESHIELLEPIGQEGPVSKFIAKNGEGMHHIALATDNIGKETERVTALGINPLGEPSTGAGGKQIVFLHPRQTNRVLLELVEPKDHHH